MTTDANPSSASTASATTPPAATSSPLSRELILDATWQCLCIEGYDATTIRRIASHLNCSVGSIYRYFNDKHELLLAVTQRVLLPVRDLLSEGGGFEQSITLYHDRAVRDIEAYRLMFWLAGTTSRKAAQNGSPVLNHGPALPQVVQDILTHWAQTLGDENLAHQGWSLLHGAVMLGQGSRQVLDMLRAISAQVSKTTTRDLPPTPEQRFLHHHAPASTQSDVTLL